MKERIDILLVERRLVESRTKAQWLIKNGYVMVEGTIVNKPGKKIDNSQEILLLKEFPYVGKGGLKLEAALKNFSINVENKVCHNKNELQFYSLSYYMLTLKICFHKLEDYKNFLC